MTVDIRKIQKIKRRQALLLIVSAIMAGWATVDTFAQTPNAPTQPPSTPPSAANVTTATAGFSLGIPVPEGARVSLVAPKTDWLLGENIMLTFRVENAGSTAFRINFGGDYRFSGRNERFHVTTTDADKNPVPDPMTPRPNGGGLSTTPEIPPDGRQEFPLPLLRYCRFTKPGTYTVRVSHDLGWTADEKHPLPEATITLNLATPASDQALQVFTDTEKNLVDRADGTKMPDFTTLRDPVYLPFLTDRARKGNYAAVEGIGAIAAPDATRVLLELAASANPKVAIAACHAMNQRLPALDRDGYGIAQGDTARAYLVENAWRPTFRDPVLTRAAVLLTAKNADLVREGAEMIERLGDWEDLYQIIPSLNREMNRFIDEYPEPPVPRFALIRAARQLYRRGAAPPKTPQVKNPGECAVFLAWIQEKGWANVPADARAKVVPLLRHPLAAVRASALAALPERFVSPDLTPAARRAAEANDTALKGVRAALPDLLHDKTLVVRIKACEASAKAQDWNVKPALVNLLASSKNEWERRAASNALLALGGRYEALMLWAERLDQPGLMFDALTALCDLQAHAGSDYDATGEKTVNAKDLKARWKRFLSDHRAEIAEGKVWAWDDATFPRADLVPAHFHTFAPPASGYPPANAGESKS